MDARALDDDLARALELPAWDGGGGGADAPDPGWARAAAHWGGAPAASWPALPPRAAPARRPRAVGGVGGGPPAGAAAAAASAAAAAKAARAIARKRGNNTHTRKCRQKVNDKFSELLSILPPPDDPAATPVKHKAQILAYSITRIREISARNHYLELMLAMSSRAALARWTERVVHAAPSLTAALEPFMELVCITRKWKYAELWEPSARRATPLRVAGTTVGTVGAVKHDGPTPTIDATAAAPSLRFVASSMPPSLPPGVTERLRAYRHHSRAFTFPPRTGVPGRVFLTKRPEWLPWLTDEVAFPRSPHAQRYDVKLTFAVPVIINDEVRMVAEFYDTESRDYDPEILNVASEVASLIANAWHARHETPHAPAPPPAYELADLSDDDASSAEADAAAAAAVAAAGAGASSSSDSDAAALAVATAAAAAAAPPPPPSHYPFAPLHLPPPPPLGDLQSQQDSFGDLGADVSALVADMSVDLTGDLLAMAAMPLDLAAGLSSDMSPDGNLCSSVSAGSPPGALAAASSAGVSALADDALADDAPDDAADPLDSISVIS